MPLKKKKVSEEPEEVIITEEEQEAIEQEEQRILYEVSASFERLQLATRIVSDRFGLNDDYSVTKFNDKGKVVDITLENKDFVVSCIIKNSETQGMYVEN